MGYSNQFFQALGIVPENKTELIQLSKRVDIPVSRLRYYNDANILPTGRDMEKLYEKLELNPVELMLKMGRLDQNIYQALAENASKVIEIIGNSIEKKEKRLKNHTMVLETEYGELFQGDCLPLMQEMKSDTIDLVFADPPFNLNKLYPSNIDDNLKTEKYLQWCEKWLEECIRILKPGGSFFLWNLPAWNVVLSKFISARLTLKHWIAVDIKYTLPISGRLYPSHYSLLYYTKGPKPNTFQPDRLPMQTCPKCHGDLKDYGGYKKKMNPHGVNLTDVWFDIPPVRHAKYKRRANANELSIKLLDRIIEMSSKEGETVFDPFGGSGTTYIVAELKKRKWIGVEIGPVNDITARFEKIEEEKRILEKYRSNLNSLFPDDIKAQREKAGLWTCESVRNEAKKEKEIQDSFV